MRTGQAVAELVDRDGLKREGHSTEVQKLFRGVFKSSPL